MEKFLEELRRALEEANVENKEEILAAYLEHFSIGHEAGLTDEEIIERFDSIEDIVWKKGKSKETLDGYDIELDLVCFSDFQICCSNKIKGVQIDIDAKALNYVEIIRDGKKISLKSLPQQYFAKRKNCDFEGKMIIEANSFIKRLKINNVSCDVKCNDELQVGSFVLSNVSGDAKFNSLDAKEDIVISNTTGDVDVHFLSSPKLKLSSVSGDLTIKDLTSDIVKISTVSGDIVIHHSNDAEYQISTVSGEVNVVDGADEEKVKATRVSGEVFVSGKSMGSSVSDIIKKSFKW